jgi:hypothetical protein
LQLEVQKVDINGLEDKVKTLRRQQSTYEDHLSCVSRCAPLFYSLLYTTWRWGGAALGRYLALS